MTFSQLIAILRARWKAALGTFALVLTLVALLTWLMPRTYTAGASVVLDVKNADPIAGTVSPTIATPAYLMTQVDVITSNRVALKVVRALRLNESTEMREKWQASTKGTGSFEAWLATLLRSNLEARPSRGSNVIYISYQGSDPQFAAVVANAFVQAYLDTTLELRTMPARQSKEMFDANIRATRAALEDALQKLSAFQQRQGLLVTDARLDVETARLNELSTQIVALQSAAADSSSRQAAANAQGDRSPDIVQNPLIATLKADLIRQQSTLEQLTTRYGDQHPAVAEARSGIAETTQKLEGEIRRVTSSVGVNNAVNQSRLSQIRAQLDEQRAKVMKMKAIRDEAAILERDVDNAQRAYDGVLARMNNTNLESQANQANVSALEAAYPPALPTSPRVFLQLTLGALLGMAMAIAVTLLMERLDRRLRTDTDVEDLMHLPVIGAIPAFRQRPKSGQDLAARFALSAPKFPALPNKA